MPEKAHKEKHVCDQSPFNLTKMPKRFEIGENWVLLNAGEEYRYRITELHANGEIKIEKAGPSPEEIRSARATSLGTTAPDAAAAGSPG